MSVGGVVEIVVFAVVLDEPRLIDAGLFPLAAVFLMYREDGIVLCTLPCNTVFA